MANPSTCSSSLTMIATLLALSLLMTVSSSTKPLISTNSKDQIACTMCDSCENPCQPANPPPPPEIICPPPPSPPPPPPPPKQPECPPPPAPSTCSDCTPCAGCAPPTIIQPFPHPPPPPQPGGVYMPPGVNPYFPYTPYKTPPSDDSAASYRSRFTSVLTMLLCFCTLAALCF